MISGLLENQKEWVVRTRSRKSSQFFIGADTYRLALEIFNSFDAESRSLKLTCGNIKITDQDVYNTLGLPVGEQIFMLASISDKVDLWSSQFPDTPHYNISPSTVIDKIGQITEATEMFKLNFMMIISNSLIERNINSYLIRDVLDYDIDLDNCLAYYWGDFLLRSLVKTKTVGLQSNQFFILGQ